MALPNIGIAGLGSRTTTIDDVFTQTWMQIKPEAIDNILNSIVVTAALKEAGSFKAQVGGDLITRTIRYGTESASAVEKGDTLPQGEPTLKTMARWEFRNIASHVQRSLFDDRENQGQFRIASYVQDRLQAAREAIEDKIETRLLSAEVTGETGKELQSLLDLLPHWDNRSTGTYGQIARPTAYGSSNLVQSPSTGNTWWGPNYKLLSAPVEVNLLSDLKDGFLGVSQFGRGAETPNLLMANLATTALYEDYALDSVQIVKDSGTFLADLGFKVLRFKGVPWVAATGVPASDTYGVLGLNTNFIEFVYDPTLWFEMTNWKDIPLQGERIAHIIASCNLVSAQPRRHIRFDDDDIDAS